MWIIDDEIQRAKIIILKEKTAWMIKYFRTEKQTGLEVVSLIPV